MKRTAILIIAAAALVVAPAVLAQQNAPRPDETVRPIFTAMQISPLEEPTDGANVIVTVAADNVKHRQVELNSLEWGQDIVVKDTGTWPDEAAGDGLYTGLAWNSDPREESVRLIDESQPGGISEIISVTCKIEWVDDGDTSKHCGGKRCNCPIGIGCICFYDCSVTIGF